MPNLVESVPIMLDKERHLKLTLWGARQFKKETGINIMKAWDTELLMDPDILADFLWACLIHEDETLTIDDVSRMIDFIDIPTISMLMTSALTKGLPDAKPPIPNVPDPAIEIKNP